MFGICSDKWGPLAPVCIVLRRLEPILAACLIAVATNVDAADPNIGRDITANCANCHGTDGHSRGVLASLAGRDRNDLVRTMQEFRDGRRPSTVMQQLAKGYTDAQIAAAAAYLAAQKPE